MNQDKQQQILDYYLSGGTLTVVTCREKFHTTELRRINSRLKDMGYNIVGDFINPEEGAPYKEYRLLTEPIQMRLAV